MFVMYDFWVTQRRLNSLVYREYTGEAMFWGVIELGSEIMFVVLMVVLWSL